MKIYPREEVSEGSRSSERNEGGMKDRVDKSMGIVTLIVETLAKSNPTESLRLV
jgi:hypothetical protein